MSDSNAIGDVSIPGEPRPTDSSIIRTLTIIASALTAASIAVNLLLQIAHFLKKRPVQPDQRDRLQTAALGLTVMKQLPGLVKQIRLLASQIKKPA
ncbi:MAG TPA: hypothetical protein VKX16_20020 [Chloroflexota bacterium]|nr:hypothetical protein [Chloroflexota bacterium]